MVGPVGMDLLDKHGVDPIFRLEIVFRFWYSIAEHNRSPGGVSAENGAEHTLGFFVTCLQMATSGSQLLCPS